MYFPPSEGCVDLDAKLCCYVAAGHLPVHHTESILSAADPAPQSCTIQELDNLPLV